MYGMRVAYGSIMRKNDSHTHPCPRAYLHMVTAPPAHTQSHARDVAKVQQEVKCARVNLHIPSASVHLNQPTHTSSLTSSAVDCDEGGAQTPMSAYAMNATSRVFGATL